jgi:uncharacterized damage-inducible protein DinB
MASELSVWKLMLNGKGDALMNALLLLLRHKTWATLRLIEHCQTLGGEQLRLTIPGTYSTILETLRHVVAADEDYFTVLIAQSLHHSDDHRTQVCSILGAHGLEVPRLDVWAYARSAGLQL